MSLKQFIIERKFKLIIFVILFSYIFTNILLYNSCHVHCIGGCIRANWCPELGNAFYEINEWIFTVLISPLLVLSVLLLLLFNYSTTSQVIEILATIILSYLYACLIHTIFSKNKHQALS